MIYKYLAGLQGVEICGEAQIILTNSAQSFEWKGYGLKLHIKENSLPADVKQLTFSVAASIAGHYEFPKNSQPVSAVYWFSFEPRCKLEKEVTVEMQHCAISTTGLSFVRASSASDRTIASYTFDKLESSQAQFTDRSSYGIIKLRKFCGMAIVADESAANCYSASLFYLTRNASAIHRDIHFAVTRNTEPHRTVSCTLIGVTGIIKACRNHRFLVLIFYHSLISGTFIIRIFL